MYNMKLIKESIEFKRGEDPKKSLEVGLYSKIKKWMNEMGVEEESYIINSDFTINLIKYFSWLIDLGGASLNKPIEKFPEFIKFNIAHKGADFSRSGFFYLNGFPKIIKGDFYLDGNNIISLDGFPEEVEGNIFFHNNKGNLKPTEEMIRAICKIPADSWIITDELN